MRVSKIIATKVVCNHAFCTLPQKVHKRVQTSNKKRRRRFNLPPNVPYFTILHFHAGDTQLFDLNFFVKPSLCAFENGNAEGVPFKKPLVEWRKVAFFERIDVYSNVYKCISHTEICTVKSTCCSVHLYFKF
jgi:hypothetical protein